MQIDNSYRKIPLIKLHVHFIISILKHATLDEDLTESEIQSEKRWNLSLLCIPDIQRCPRIGHNPLPPAHPVNRLI